MINRILGSIFLICGTSIGASMLGLPVKMAAAGFYGSFLVFFIVWIIMIFSGLLILESSFWVNNTNNIITIIINILGEKIKYFIIIIYLLLLYSLMCAYVSGSIGILCEFLKLKIYFYDIKYLLLIISFIFPFAFIIYFGINYVDYFNRFFLFFLFFFYFLFLFRVCGNIDFFAVEEIGNKKFLFNSISIVVTSFGYHHLIPILRIYLNNNILALKISIILGSFISFIVYVIWQYVIFNVIGIWNEYGLVDMMYSIGNPSEKLISKFDNFDIFASKLLLSFSFVAIVSSLIGVSLGIYNFFFDSIFFIKNNFIKKIYILILVFIIPLFFSVIFPTGFILALNYAGIFASMLLLILPTIVVWYGRYIRNNISFYKVFGGKLLLLLLLLLGLFVVIIEILNQFKILLPNL